MRLSGAVGSSYPSQSPVANVQHTINWYLEVDESGSGKNSEYLYPTPGLKLFADLAEAEFTPAPPEPPTPTDEMWASCNYPQGAVIGLPYSHALGLFNVTPPVTWDLKSGAFPEGLTLGASTGIISGDTIKEGGEFEYTARVTKES